MSNISFNYKSDEVLGKTSDVMFSIKKIPNFEEIKPMLSELYGQYKAEMEQKKGKDIGQRNVQSHFDFGIEAAQNAYLKEANDIVNYLHSVKLYNDSGQMADGLMNAQSAFSQLQYGIPVFSFYYKGVSYPDFLSLTYVKNMNGIITRIMGEIRDKGKETQISQQSYIRSVTSSQSQPKESGLSKLLIPLALGVGGFMLLKG